MRTIVLLVLFVVVMFLWLLALLSVGGIPASPWLAFFAVAFLGVAVFLPGPPIRA